MMGSNVPRIMPRPKVLSPIPIYKILDQAIVDGEQWYTVRVYLPPIMTWVRNNNKAWLYEHPSNGRDGIRFDIHEKLFTLFTLKWA